MRSFLKRVLPVALAALMLLAPVTGAAAGATARTVAAEDKVYHFGKNLFNLDDPGVAQGSEGWYFLYSTTTNAGETFPTDTLSEAVRGTSGKWDGKWAAPKGDSYADWWNIQPTGYLGPDTGFAVALKWVVPEDGSYTAQIDYWGGSNSTADEVGNDGVIFFVYQNDQLLSRAETMGKDSAAPEQGDGSEAKPYKVLKTESLKKGDAFYMIVDPKTSSAYDNPWWDIEFTLHAEAESQPSGSGSSSESSTPAPPVGEGPYTFGGDKFDINGKDVVQGSEGWFYLYSQRADTGEGFPLDSLREAERRDGEWKVPESVASAQWYRVRSDGYMSPDNGISVGVKWVAPADGKYLLSIDYWGGSSDTSQELSDGVIFFVYWNDELLSRTETDGKSNLTRAASAEAARVNGEVTLKKGDAVYMIADPKKNSGYDNPWWSATITKLSGAAAGGAASPATGSRSVASAAALGMALAASAFVLLAVRRK